MSYRAWVYKEPVGYSVWTVSPYTGSKSDCLLPHTSRKREAVKVQRDYNRKLEAGR